MKRSTRAKAAAAIRPIAAAVIRDGDRILVWDDPRPGKAAWFAGSRGGRVRGGRSTRKP